MNKKIIMLVGGGPSSYCNYNALKDHYPISNIIIETEGNLKTFLKKRIKKFGIVKVIGQILFQKIVVPFLKRESKTRVAEIILTYDLSFKDFDPDKLIKVPSVNSDECIDTLKKIEPDIIIVNGTRVISKKVLNSINATFINTHAGITPLYRGIHGAYWSKVNKDCHCGVTVHLVDLGIDTGGILFQDIIETNSQDNFVSYTYLQMAKGIELMKLALNNLINNESKVITNNLESKIWTHPTIWFYLKNRIIRKVK
ncbi:formyl transferase [Gaetbulibacter sp. M235]|uniref:formyl transferase n=1 Tax=Gaetbulibacter sp. M235 TaxID=3126510 RepID=UPI00374FCE14